MDILKTYRLFRQINQYPQLMGLMRSIFMDVLEQKGIITREKLHQRAREELLADGLPDTEANRQEYVESLIDYYFANNLSPGEIENYINLARKKDMAQTLSMVVNRDQATAMEVIKALREFCDIPKGRGLYLPGRGGRDPGCPDQPFLLEPASFYQPCQEPHRHPGYRQHPPADHPEPKAAREAGRKGCRHDPCPQDPSPPSREEGSGAGGIYPSPGHLVSEFRSFFRIPGSK